MSPVPVLLPQLILHSKTFLFKYAYITHHNTFFEYPSVKGNIYVFESQIDGIWNWSKYLPNIEINTLFFVSNTNKNATYLNGVSFWFWVFIPILNDSKISVHSGTMHKNWEFFINLSWFHICIFLFLIIIFTTILKLNWYWFLVIW